MTTVSDLKKFFSYTAKYYTFAIINKMKAASFIASKIFSLSRDKLSSSVMRLAITAVALGIVVMIVSLAVITGFKHEVRNKVIGFVAPLQISAINQNESFEETPFEVDAELTTLLESIEEVSSYQYVGNKAGIVKTENEIQGVVMRGVDSNYDWSYMKGNLIAGRTPEYHADSRSLEVLVSKIVADKLSVSVGDALRVWFVDKDMKPRGRRFEIAGVYETGLYEFDERYVFCDLNQIRKLNNWSDNQVGVIEVRFKAGTDIDYVNNTKIYFSLPFHLTSYTAMQSYPSIFDWLNLLDANVVVIIALIMLVSGIAVISMLLIIIIEQTSTIGLLKALGADSRLIRRIFLHHSAKLLLIGLAIGDVIGVLVCMLQKHFHIVTLDPTNYYLSSVPIELNIWTLVLLNIGTMLLWFVMLLLPTALINNISPSKSIRFE